VRAVQATDRMSAGPPQGRAVRVNVIECQPARRGPAGGPADDRPDPTAPPTPDPDPPPNAWDGRAGRPSQAAPQSLPSRPQRHARMPSTPAAAAAIQVKPTQGGAPGQAGDATSGQTGALGARRDPAGAAPVCPGAATVNQAVSPSTKRSHCQPSTAPAKKTNPRMASHAGAGHYCWERPATRCAPVAAAIAYSAASSAPSASWGSGRSTSSM